MIIAASLVVARTPYIAAILVVPRTTYAASSHVLAPRFDAAEVSRKVDVRLPEKVNSNSHGARPVHLVIAMIEWMCTSKLSTKNSLSLSLLQ